MQQPPSPSECLRYPITTCIGALAIIGTLRWWSGADIERFMTGSDRWWLDPWRLVTPVLFHGNSLHLIFNLYWFWLFGTKIEDEFGQGRTLGIYVMLAAGSNTAELAIFRSCVGLSGVVYGLFGMLWVLSKSDRRFRDFIDRRTTELMVGWFFFCIALTVTNVMGVANVAHGVGCLLGILLGWTITARNRGLKLRNGIILAAVFLLCIAGGTIARPYVNLSGDAGQQLAYQGYVALEAGDSQRAVELYERAVAANPNVFGWWNNLGIAYRQAGRVNDAHAAFLRAASLDAKRSDSQ